LGSFRSVDSGVGGGTGCPQGLQLFDGIGDGMFQAGLVAAKLKQVALLGAVRHEEPAERSAGRIAGARLESLMVAAVDLVFHIQGTIEAPLGGGYESDEFLAGSFGRPESGTEVGEQVGVFGGILFVEEVGFGAQAVGDAVAAGGSFAFWGAGAGAFPGVLPVGVELGFGGHMCS
jgi:hypothetical protein